MKAFLGLDIASVNAGLSVLVGDPVPNVVKSCALITTPVSHKASDLTKAKYQVSQLKKFLIDNGKPKAVCVEAPAMGSANQAVSIGFIHGFVMNSLLRLNIPILYCVPTKWKWALLGHGRADKAVSISFVKDNFSLPKRIDHNQADATCLAYLAYCFHCFLEDSEPVFIGGREKEVKEIFFNPKPLNQPAGIMLRENVFYFLPNQISQ